MRRLATSNGTLDIMREKKESETEERVRRLATSNGTLDIMREEKESETEEPVRRLATSDGTWDIMREKRKRNRGACEEPGDEQRNLRYNERRKKAKQRSL